MGVQLSLLRGSYCPDIFSYDVEKWLAGTYNILKSLILCLFWFLKTTVFQDFKRSRSRLRPRPPKPRPTKTTKKGHQTSLKTTSLVTTRLLLLKRQSFFCLKASSSINKLLLVHYQNLQILCWLFINSKTVGLFNLRCQSSLRQRNFPSTVKFYAKT